MLKMNDSDDPFPDPDGLTVPEAVPTVPPDGKSGAVRIAEDEDPLATLPEEEAERERRKAAAAASALTLEMVGDLPFANVRPPENVLFVCKLNSVTRDEDLDLIFSRFGKIMSCQVIRDKRTGDSLQYAFIEFDKREDAEQVRSDFLMSVFTKPTRKAYFKMQNVLIDDRRIWVDLWVQSNMPLLATDLSSLSSQSVARLNTHWSNNPTMAKGRRNRDGFAGREDLEATQRYRRSDTQHDSRGGYGMVFDVDDISKSSRRRSRSRDRDRDRGRDRRERHGRSRSRSPRHRGRSRSVERYQERDYDRRRDRGR